MCTAAVVTVLVLLFAVGLRDKIVYIAARSEQYLPALVMFAVLPVPGHDHRRPSC